MKKLCAAFVLLGGLAHADQVEEKMKESGFYIKLGSGASFANRAHISASPVIWDPAVQGYNGSLGTRPIVLGGLGYDSPFVSTDITASYRPNFKYSKLQTPTTGSTPGALGGTTRRFDLDVSSLLLNLYLNGRGFSRLNWKVGQFSSIFPFVGGGVGISQMKIFNFRSTGLPPVVDSLPSFASENQYTVKYRFTYQLMAGLEYRYRDMCALVLGYRWLDVSRFEGPRYIRDADGNAIDVQSYPWKIKFAANEAILEFKILL